jgi:hypothetical protein
MHKNGKQNNDWQWDAEQPKQHPASESHGILLLSLCPIPNADEPLVFQILEKRVLSLSRDC